VSAGQAVFLDRDGVLVEAIVRDGRPYAPTSLDAFHLVPDAGTEVARLRDAGLRCLLFTNQPEVARGLLPADVLAEMHARLRAQVPLDAIYVCPHDPTDGCACYKPRPGMLHEAASEWSLDLTRSFVIGDRWRDIEAGHAVGCYTILLARPYSACSTAHAEVESLAAAVDLVLDRLD
jgi:D-glycero-D-manno-heptose 1,7-bisphosphate phosphatase